MKEGFKQNTKVIDTLLIDNCGIKDSELKEVLMGCEHLEQVKSLIIKKTDLGFESLSVLERIFERSFPNQI